MEHVLNVERQGLRQLRDAEQEAQRLLAQARAEAAAIASRTDARITRLHGGFLQKVQREIERLKQSSQAPDARAAGAHDEATLAQAARRVAAKLTGGT